MNVVSASEIGPGVGGSVGHPDPIFSPPRFARRVGRSGAPTRHFLRRAARGGSVGREDRPELRLKNRQIISVYDVLNKLVLSFGDYD